MNKPLRIIILEDNYTDAELVKYELEEAGFTLTVNISRDKNEYIQALQEFKPDIILSDYDLPQYNGALALADAKRLCSEVPFILVTGAVSEDRAIEILTSGAKDYVMKNRISRLVPAVRRVLAETEEHKARKKAEEDLRMANAELELKIREKTASLEEKIKEHKRTEEELRTSEERFRVAVMNSNLTFSQFDRDLKYTWISNPHPDFQTPIGKRSDEVRDCEGTRRASAIKRVVLETGKGVRAEISYELSDGVHIYDSIIEPIYNSRGDVIGGAIASLNITETKKAEEALEISKEQLRQRVEEVETLMEVAPVAIWKSYDPHCNNVIGNEAANRFFEAYEQENVSANMTGVRRFFKNGKELTAEELPMQVAAAKNIDVVNEDLDILLPSGKKIHLIGSARPLRDENGGVRGCVGAFLDITGRIQTDTDRETLIKSLLAANKDLDSFTYSVSHDLRAPLRAIDGYSRIILKRNGDKFDEETKRQFNQVRSSAKAMGTLIDDLLALSKSGRQGSEIRSLNIRRIIKRAWEELQNSNPGRNMKLQINSPMPPGSGDEGLIQQVVVNLLANAVKFTKTREAALIEAGGYKSDTESIYYIKDNGVGFDMQYHDKLFGAFQRLHSDNEYEGTGIGTALVKRIIHRHGGQVWAKGEVGKGATFYFSLPRRLDHK